MEVTRGSIHLESTHARRKLLGFRTQARLLQVNLRQMHRLIAKALDDSRGRRREVVILTGARRKLLAAVDQR